MKYEEIVTRERAKAKLVWFIRERLQVLLEREGSAAVGVMIARVQTGLTTTLYPDLVLPKHLLGQSTVMFHVGHALNVPASVVFDDTDAVIRWTGVFRDHGRVPVVVPYELLAFARPMTVGGPDGGRRITA